MCVYVCECVHILQFQELLYERILKKMRICPLCFKHLVTEVSLVFTKHITIIVRSFLGRGAFTVRRSRAVFATLHFLRNFRKDPIS